MSDPISECLFGDSTPAPLKADFIAFLRDMVDFAAEALKCQGQASDATQTSALLVDATERGIARAEALASQVTSALERTDISGAESVVGSCVAKLRSATWDIVRSEASAARAAAAATAARAAQTAALARTACERALEGLLLRHEPPNSVSVIKLGVDGGTGYDARLRGQTTYGLSWDVGLQIPASHPLSRVLRIDRVVERLEISVPEETGWPHKGIKVRPQRLDRLYIVELIVTPVEMFLKLRAAPDGTGAGCNLWHLRDGSAARLERVVATDAAPDLPCDVEGDEGQKLRVLCDSLASMAGEIALNRQLPVAARIDDKPIHEYEASVVVERFVANVAPQVEEIARRSLASGELVLRRRLSDNRREEVFLSKAELLAKVEGVPPTLRGVFAPLNLGHVAFPSPSAEGAPSAPNTVRMAPDTTAPPPKDDHEPTVIIDESATESWQASTRNLGTNDVKPAHIAPPEIGRGAARMAAPRP